MKTILLSFLTSFLILSGVDGQSKWKIVNEGSGIYPWKTDFIDANTAWIIDNQKGIMKTTDGGQTWLSILESNPFFLFGFDIMEMDFISDLTGWVLKADSEDLQILKTLDGGQTWVYQKSVDRAGSFIAINIYAVNENTVYVLAKGVLKTIDGGTSWVDVTPPGSSDFSIGSFLNADKGVVISTDNYDVKSLFRTSNGGEDWAGKAIPEFREICDIAFLKDSIGYFRADEYPSGNYRLYKTTDSFKSWVALTDEKNTIYGYHFFDEDLVISIMEDSSGTNLMKSEDGGVTWEYWGDFKLPANWGYQFHFFENVGYLICNSGNPLANLTHLSLRTVNQGNSWDILNFSYPLKDVSFINGTKGFLAGGYSGAHEFDGSLINTDDGFKTFDFPLGRAGGTLAGPTYIYSCQFISDSIGFYTDGTLMKTSDGGESWIKDNTFHRVFDICLINESVIYALWGNNLWHGNFIHKTTNGGASWNTFYTSDDDDFTELYSIFFIDENTGWVVGWTGEDFDNHNSDGRPKIQKYSEEQGWREIPVEANLPLNKIYFVDQDHGWILGGYSNPWDDQNHPLLLRSVDGGESWSEVKGIDYLINDIYFENISHGWAVGEDSIGRGVILETFDGGLTWDVEIDSLSGRLHALHIKDGHGWAVGDNGLILNYPYPSSVSRFMVFGDAHHHSPSPDFSQSMLYELTLAAIREEVDFVFLTGDLGLKTFETPEEKNLVLKDWQFAQDILDQHSINVYACRGNVDAGSRETWNALFSGRYAFPQNGPEMEKNLTYAIEHENLLFVAMDQYTDSHKINQEWLDSLFATTTREHIFVAGHEPAFKVSMTNCMGAFPEDRNLFWESVSNAGAKAYFSGHDHFFDHSVIDDGDSNLDNDIHQVIVGTGGGSLRADAEYDGDNGRWTPERISHVGAHGYVLVEINGSEAEMTWKRRISPNTYVKEGDPFTFTTRTTGLREIDQNLGDLMNYPNPFQSRTVISYQISATGHVELSIYDLTGRKVATLVKEHQQAGMNEVEWYPEGTQPGIYFCELKTGWGREVIKMILVK